MRIKQKFLKNKTKKRENKLWLAIKRWIDMLYYKASVSAVGRSLNDYVGEEKILEKSFFIRNLKAGASRIDFKKVKYTVQRGVENSRILSVFSAIVNALMTAMVRQYGLFTFSIGLYTLLVYFIGGYTDLSFNTSYLHILIGALEIFCALPMLISKKTLCEVLRESVIADIILFKFFGLSPELFEKTRKEGSLSSPIPLILGLLAGLATTYISPLTLLVAAGIAVMVGITLLSPESGLVSVIAFMPFISENYLRTFIWVIALAYMLKVIRGKRIFKLELTDYAVLMLGFIILFSGTVSISADISRSYSFVTVTYMVAYFMIVNTVKTKPWVQRFATSVVMALIFSIICGSAQKFVSRIDFIFTEDIIKRGEVSATFSSPIVLAQFIILFAFYLFAYNISTKASFIRKLFVFILSVLSVVCLFYTDTPIALCCFVAALFVFYILYSKRTLIFTVLIFAALPFVKYVLPPVFSKVVLEYAAVIKQALIERMYVWRISLNMVFERLIGGSGSGTYEYLYSQYAVSGHEGINSSYNTYLQTAVELGIIGLIVFLAVIYLFIKCNLSLFAKQGAGVKNIYSVAGFSGIIGVLLLANFENLWQDPKSIFSFWVALGLCMAIKRQRLLVQKGYDEYLLKNI